MFFWTLSQLDVISQQARAASEKIPLFQREETVGMSSLIEKLQPEGAKI